MKDATRTADPKLRESLHQDASLNKKLNILNAQLKDAAALHPEGDILFYFYDDAEVTSWEKPPLILQACKDYFTQHPERIPQNITLVLMHYSHVHRARLRQQGVVPNPELEYCRLTGLPKRTASPALVVT
jgi:hypothetical protein